MEIRTMCLGHFLVISLALNAGLLYRDYCNGKHKSQDFFFFNNGFKNASLAAKRDAHVAKRTPFETKAPLKALGEVIDLD
ncbi:UNVERIFIED_CONTAM: hypothetical protein Sindi_0188700, partial [Sesamum indicum]